MSKNNKSSVIELDIDETIPRDVLIKLYYLCQKRKLPFPEGIVFLIDEVCKPCKTDEFCKVKNKTSSKRGK